MTDDDSADDQKYTQVREHMQEQLRHQGYSVVSTGDGTVIMFSSATLKHLLSAAKKSPNDEVLLFIKHTEKQDLN